MAWCALRITHNELGGSETGALVLVTAPLVTRVGCVGLLGLLLLSRYR